jgi:Tfp pilus assembly protein PilV
MSLIELMVAATLIISGLTVVGKLSVASGRMWQQTRHERVAIEELSNQLERLIALSPQQRQAEIADLVPSPHTAEMLPGARLAAETIHDPDGSRLQLQIDWNHGVLSRSIRLVGWIDSAEIVQDENQEPIR